MLLAQVLSSVVAFFYMIYAARYLGPVDFGILSFAIAFTTIFAVFADFGLHAFMIRGIARERLVTDRYLFNASFIKIIMAIITFGLIAATINMLGYRGESIIAVYFLGISVVLNSFMLMYMAVYQAHEKLEYIGINQALNAILIFAGVILAIKLNMSITGFAFIYLVVSLVCLIYNIFIIRIQFSFSSIYHFAGFIKFDRSLLKFMIRESIPFGFIALFACAYTWIDSVLLSTMGSEEALGWYGAAYRLVISLLFIPSALVGAVYPIMSRQHEAAISSLKITFEKSFKYLMIIALPICIGTTLLADRLIPLFYGSEFMPSASSIKILIWTIPFAFANVILGTLLYAINKQSIVTKIYFVALTTNIILNIVFIPAFSYLGVSIVKVTTECLIFVLMIIVSYGTGYIIHIKPGLKVAAKELLAVIAMGIFIWYFDKMNLALLIIIAAAIYFAVIYILRIMDDTDIVLIKDLIGVK